MGDFVKFYNGEWCEPGNFGKESIIAENTWHSKIVYLQKYGVYLMTSTKVKIEDDGTAVLLDAADLRESEDLKNWSKPVGGIARQGREFGNHYVALASVDDKSPVDVISDDKLCFLTNHNGTDVALSLTHI